MDRLNKLRGEAGCSRDTTLDNSTALSEAYITANESSKYFSLSDSSFDISPEKDASSVDEHQKTTNENDQLISELSPIENKNDLISNYQISNQIEAANILSGGVQIFNDNSYDGSELVIDENTENNSDDIADNLHSGPAIGSRDTEIVLQFDGVNVKAIDIGNGLYLYRKAGEEELAALQIIPDNDQPSFKFLKVRDNMEGNLEVYEEIEIEVPKEGPTEHEKPEKSTSHVPDNNVNRVTSDPANDKIVENKPLEEVEPVASTSANDEINKVVSSETKTDLNKNEKIKFNETRKSPFIHSTPNKEGIPLTKTMVDMQLHPGRPLDKVKTIEVHTDNIKQKITDNQAKNKDVTDDSKFMSKSNSKEVDKIELASSNTNCDSNTKISVKEKVFKDLFEDRIISIEGSEVKQLHPIKCGVETHPDKVRKEEVKSKTHTDVETTVKSVPVTSTENSETNTSIVKERKKAIEITASDSASPDIIIEENKNDNYYRDLQLKSDPTNNEKLESTANPDDVPRKIVDQNSAIKEKELKKPGQAMKISKSENAKNVVEVECGMPSVSIECKEENIQSKDKIQKLNTLTENTKPENKLDTAAKTTVAECVVPPEISNKDVTKTMDNTTTESKNFSQAYEIIEKNTSIETKQIQVNAHPSEIKSTFIKDYSKLEMNAIDQEKVIECDTVTLKNTDTDQFSANQNPKPLDKECKPPAPISLEKQAIGNPKECEDTQKKDTKIELKSKLPAIVPMVPPKNCEAYYRTQNNVEKKSKVANINAPVPFGQWTPANRQEFLNKIKEAKIPTNVSNTKQTSISKPNDLNRRDVLQKIDIQRQSSSVVSKTQETAKLNIKNEIPTFKNKPAIIASNTCDSKLPVKVESQALKTKPVLPIKPEKPAFTQAPRGPQAISTVTSINTAKSDAPHRNEFTPQDLIDKTVEGIINRAVSAKHQDPKPNIPKETKRIMKTQSQFTSPFKPKDHKPFLDAIEMKMNELHGIPFVERPPHELPKVYNRDIKTYAKTDTIKSCPNKASKIPNLLPVTKSQQKEIKDTVIDLDSEEEIIEHEPITGDINLYKNNMTSKLSNTSADTTVAQVGSESSRKESVITEKDFDKFVRRNSITYENCLTVNLEQNKNCNLVHSLSQKDLEDKTTKNKITEANMFAQNTLSVYENNHSNKIQISSISEPINEDALNKNYPSKLKLAYHTALTTKRQMESPITILEDKPVKVVFMNSSADFQLSQVNVQGAGLSPSKKDFASKEIDSVTISTGDSLDSDVLDSIEAVKIHEETRSNKTKHQRKQVLTPVETPELELIGPKDLGIEVTPKKKRRTEDIKSEKGNKNFVPKKTYLLGRTENSDTAKDLNKDVPKSITQVKKMPVSLNDTASAIDNLVKAAELIENQSGTFKANTDTAISDSASPVTPAKRGRGRPRKYPLPDSTPNTSKVPSSQKKPRLIDAKEEAPATDDNISDDNEKVVRENWTMGDINENIVCPICNKLFRSENVVYKHVKHCTGPSPNRSDSDKRSRRRSRLSNDSSTLESKLDDSNGETDSVVVQKSTAMKRKSKESISSGKDVIVIEDAPINNKVEKSELKRHESRKPTKTSIVPAPSLSCEYCGKNFRQLSYLVSHKLLHKKANSVNKTQETVKSVFSCEVCKKEFRKLHHLVQHRLLHNSVGTAKLSRKSSSEQNSDSKMSKEKDKQVQDQSAAFRCEPCDKSFRKLHHLVEHRETHDGINRQKNILSTQIGENFKQSSPPPQICKKSKQSSKRHNLIEHKEKHLEIYSDKPDDKGVESSLATKDIIHECSLCYMVFPNEHSLNKHSVFCQRKKRQSANKQCKQLNEPGIIENIEIPVAQEDLPNDATTPETIDNIAEKSSVDSKPVDIRKINDEDEEKKKYTRKDQYELNELLIKPSGSEHEPEKIIVDSVENAQAIQNNLKIQTDEVKEVSKYTNVTPKRKTPVKGALSATKRRKSDLPLSRIKETKEAMESSDDDEVRYMLNPDYKDSIDSSEKTNFTESTSEVKFMNIRSIKRNSLQFEKPNSKELLKRRTWYQHPPKVARLKPELAEIHSKDKTPTNPLANIPILEHTDKMTDSDDSDVKYSFPKKVQKTVELEKATNQKRKSLTNRQKMLGSIARRKSLGKLIPAKHKEKASPANEVKRRRPVVEHRCDCGQLFSSAALLARHTTLAHTPPRVRRRRPPSPAPPPPPPPPPTPARRPADHKLADSRKSSTRSDPDNAVAAKVKPGRPPGKTPGRPSEKSTKDKSTPMFSGVQSRKTVAHRGVPVPEKMKKIVEKLKK